MLTIRPLFRALLCLVLLAASAQAQPAKKVRSTAPANDSPVLVRVGEATVTQADVERMMKSRRIPPAVRDKLTPVFVEQLIDQRLMENYLASRKIVADPTQLDQQVARILKLTASNAKPDEVMAELGYTPESLRAELALPIQWAQYMARVTTEEQIAEHFNQHRPELDGTEIRVSHILLKVPTDEDSPELEAARKELEQIRSSIEAKKFTFAEAAEKYSQAPSSTEGGDVGFISFQGKMPTSFCEVAFTLELGAVSEPITTKFGVHLCVVTDRKPGDLSLEDARPEVLSRLSRTTWDSTVAGLRRRAKIERVASK